MRRFILTLTLAATAVALSAGESQAFFFRKKATATPVVTYAAPVVSTPECGCGATMPAYGTAPSYYGSTYTAPSYYGTPSYGMSSGSSTGLLGTVGNVGTNVIGGAANILTLPFRALR